MSVTVILTQSILPDTGLALDSLTPIIRFAQDPQVVAVRTESKFKTYKELTDAARDGNVVAGITGPTGSGRAALYLHRARHRRQIQVRDVQGRRRRRARDARRPRRSHDGKPERDAAAGRGKEDAHPRSDGRTALQAGAGCPDAEGARLQDGGRDRARVRNAVRACRRTPRRPWKRH